MCNARATMLVVRLFERLRRATAHEYGLPLAAVARRNTETSEHDHKQDAELRATQTRIAELERQHEEKIDNLRNMHL